MFGRSLFALTFMLIVGASAQAGTVTYGPDTIPVTTTSWSDSVSMQKWDPTLFPGQTLTGVSFKLTGTVLGDARFESLDSSPATVLMFLQATITLTDPSNVPLVVVLPTVNTSDSVGAFDNVIDFQAPSGKSYVGLTNTLSNTGTSMNFALFTGSGSITLPVIAAGSSSATGAGNLITQFATEAGASAEVTYTYEAQGVPVPASAWMGGVLLAGLGVRKLRKRVA